MTSERWWDSRFSCFAWARRFPQRTLGQRETAPSAVLVIVEATLQEEKEDTEEDLASWMKWRMRNRSNTTNTADND